MNYSYNAPEEPKYTFEMPNRVSIRHAAQRHYSYVDGYDNAFIDGAEYMANIMGKFFVSLRPELKEEVSSFCEKLRRDPKTICIPLSNKEYFDILDKRRDTIAMNVSLNPHVGDTIYVPMPKSPAIKDSDEVLQVNGFRAIISKVYEDIPGLEDKVLVVVSDIHNFDKGI